MLIAFDLEGTLVDAEMFPELGKWFGNGALLNRITRQAMNGELRYEKALLRRSKIIRGLSIEKVRDVCLQLPLFKGRRRPSRH